MKKKHLKIYALIFWIFIIFINSLLPGDVSTAQSGFVTNIIKGLLNLFNIRYDVTALSSLIRSLAHFIEFFILGMLVMLNKTVLNTIYKRMSLIILIPLIDEVIQIFVPNRAFEWFDITIDLLGGLLGMLTLWFMTLLFKQLEQRHHS